MSKIAIIGAGAWGTALSIVLGRQNRHDVRLWAYEEEVRKTIAATGKNEFFLPQHRIPECVAVTDNLADASKDAAFVVGAMPSQYARALFERLSPHLGRETMVVSATKGLEQSSLLRMSEVICLVAPHHCSVGALSGPSFAAEVARGDPTALAIASGDPNLTNSVQREFSDSSFRLYRNDDTVGVELGGSLKNVIAIAAGVCHGLGLGHNSIAALITRGLAEMTRLVVACGGRPETTAGLAGLGDLVLTCTGDLSRNRSVGVELGRGRKLQEIIAAMHGQVAEGVFTTNAAVQLARSHRVEMPIAEQMSAILNEGKPPQQAIQELMSREFKSEAAVASTKPWTK
jgi:glycerol-3-phosphate dehydrogenase (NAD(P)+)